MNNQTIAGQEVRVQFARGERRNFGDRGGFNDRGGSYGGPGGYQSRPFDGDRPPRRDFGDRPRGCFNCGEEGHMIRDCTKRTLDLNQLANPENSTTTEEVHTTGAMTTEMVIAPTPAEATVTETDPETITVAIVTTELIATATTEETEATGTDGVAMIAATKDAAAVAATNATTEAAEDPEAPAHALTAADDASP